MSNVTEIFGSNVFNDRVMRARLPKDVYKNVQNAIKLGKRLEASDAAVVANSMKDWAIEHGATHFTHWFQPLTGITAEKHDSFLTPTGDQNIIMEFSGKELIQGEPDASSFPSGGLRATFEARGYTAWDPTSYAFLKDGVLCIPTAFCSYGGEALDKKTPLLRSMEAINKQALRVLKLFGNSDVTAVKTTVGPEQEYFLIDEKVYEQRPDLMLTGRTLYGAKAPKGQELDDHYFGAIKNRVQAFMTELDEELWKLGIYAKTEHNEVAPGQHELAPVFTTTNLAADQNQLTMEYMQKLAKKHGMVCLLHEKPFAGVNGSGKHNNWSISTDTGMNLLEPGDTPAENAQFLLFLCAVIQAVDDYQDLLRISVASAGNDHRLGAQEAPPAVVSMFLGSDLEAILAGIENDEAVGSQEKDLLRIGVHVLPKFRRDSTDRNRTSPFAFTGNKFEFRMLGSSASVSGCNIVLNTAVAESLRQYADILENAKDFESELHDLIKSVIQNHKRIIFNGNGYDDAWLEEAKKRGLLNYRTTADCAPHYVDEKNMQLFLQHKVFSEAELNARCEAKLSSYCKVLHIEANTMTDMANKDIYPAVSSFVSELSTSYREKEGIVPEAMLAYEAETIQKLSALLTSAYETGKKLDKAVETADAIESSELRADSYRDVVIPLMDQMREAVDSMEVITSSEYWPYPSYADILFSVK